MPSATRRSAALLVSVLTAALLSPLLATPAGAQQGETGCPNQAQPPPPVSTSEKPAPGQPSPKPLPVPDDPAGGPRMAECGAVLPEGAPPLPDQLTPRSWVLTDLDSGEVLAAYNPHARHRPASLIKVLTALVAAEELDPKQEVRATQEDANQEGTSVGLVPNNKYTVDQLFKSLLMYSGNDVAHALARELGGIPTALRKMNDRAAELGARDTRAATPSGLDGPGMSTSAYDMSLLMRAAMDTPEFVEAVGTPRMDFPGKPGEPSYEVYNDNKLLGSYAGFLGGKTGFTDDARHTYTGAAERDGTRIAVTMLRGEQQPVRMSDQAALLLDYGFGLANQQAEPVGELVDPKPEPSPDVTPAAAQDAETSAQSAQQDESPFGNAGGPIIALAVVAVAIYGLLWLRRKSRNTGQ
ncbi:D-alanyl-D-alanine carboxypeptidase (penicillin-binding protein 5/6) [Tamaricihabitans halophyticus]|uniref:D-alanyl-D-alanine carboxypeptidase (Penicillin-binding protein 5/6) n=1 Tax=Tamaricihabitans halophyticus TaxID=1262583 RepID=A0A4R2QJ83_9PSEU|nr:D-alanyl-D-alanine carboxypeptidase family protein [Tamaricihabitans halophyticus]TCP49327.1 D-alanyl-D-alanine carboxypeptidase (penicillin-binding protein 5/6) [Tamaricihabitans halophyticus]